MGNQCCSVSDSDMTPSQPERILDHRLLDEARGKYSLRKLPMWSTTDSAVDNKEAFNAISIKECPNYKDLCWVIEDHGEDFKLDYLEFGSKMQAADSINSTRNTTMDISTNHNENDDNWACSHPLKNIRTDF